MQFTTKQAFLGAQAARELSPAAFALYQQLRITIYKYETAYGSRYAYSGIIGNRHNLTFDELQYILGETARLVTNYGAATEPEQQTLQIEPP